MKRPAVFLDRDGTLINERGYLSDVSKIRFYAGAANALKAFQKKGFRLAVVTNQSGVGRGYFSIKTVHAVHRAMTRWFARRGVWLAAFYVCPHLPQAGCRCRKPNPGLLYRAARDLGIDLKKSYVIGDQVRDMQLAYRVGAKGVLVLTGAGRSARPKARRWAAKITPNLTSASRWILSNGTGAGK